jgi:FkbM family methyltransferase
LPFDGPSDAALIIPEIRSEVRSGTYCADVLRLLPEAIVPGDRVMVIGAGLGVVSTTVARNEGVDRVIAIEANTALIPYLNRVHALNGVSEVEVVNAVLAEGKTGRVPFFARRDLRTSSLLPHDRSWQQVIMVPFMDLNLILTDEQISLVVCDIPEASARLLGRAELATVERIVVNCGDKSKLCWEEGALCSMLTARGYSAKPHETGQSSVLFSRPRIANRALRA